MSIYRIIDVEINRVSEGLRVIEDISRFSLENNDLSSRLRNLRHKTRKEIITLNEKLIRNRNSENDIGISISQKNKIDSKSDIKGLVTANFKRIQEGLRSLEESIKVANYYKISKIYEQLRFDAYTLEKDFNMELFKTARGSPLNTDLYGITGSKFSRGRSNKEVVTAMINAGIKIIQYREKEKSLKVKYTECLQIRKLTKEADVTFIINDDITLAQIVDADGIHLGQEDLPLLEVRSIVGEKMILGLSTHSPEQALEAVKVGADYIGVGPIFKTYTKKNVCAPVGFEYLEWVIENIQIPFVAIGGIKIHNIQEIIQRKAKCIAMVTEIVGADNIEETIKDIKRNFKNNIIL
jgi:thiamine-phosphate pyrophosphorylase